MRIPVFVACQVASGSLALPPILILVALNAAACAQPATQVAPQTVRMLTGGKGNAYDRLGSVLAPALMRTLPRFRLEVEHSAGSVANVEQIEQGHADLAMAQSDAVFGAYSQGTDSSSKPHTHLRAIARLFPNALHIVVRQNSPLSRVTDLAGRRVGIRDQGNGVPSRTLRQVLESHRIVPEAVQLITAPRGDLLEGLRDGRFDAVVVLSGVPTPLVIDMSSALSTRLIGIDDGAMHEIRSRFLFFRPITVPPGTYPGHDSRVVTVGIDTVLICRDTLDEQIAFELTRAFFESLPALAAKMPGVRFIDADRAMATPIPLHAGAARYYRERELFR